MGEGKQGPLQLLRDKLRQDVVDDLGPWTKDITNPHWVQLAAGLMPSKVLSACRKGRGRAGDRRTYKKRLYTLQRHAIRMTYQVYSSSRKLERERLLRIHTLHPDRQRILKDILTEHDLPVDVILCQVCLHQDPPVICPADTLGGEDVETAVCDYCYEQATRPNGDSTVGGAQTGGYVEGAAWM